MRRSCVCSMQSRRDWAMLWPAVCMYCVFVGMGRCIIYLMYMHMYTDTHTKTQQNVNTHTHTQIAIHTTQTHPASCSFCLFFYGHTHVPCTFGVFPLENIQHAYTHTHTNRYIHVHEETPKRGYIHTKIAIHTTQTHPASCSSCLLFYRYTYVPCITIHTNKKIAIYEHTNTNAPCNLLFLSDFSISSSSEQRKASMLAARLSVCRSFVISPVCL